MPVLLICCAVLASGALGALLRRLKPPTPPALDHRSGDPSIGTHAGFINQVGGD
ncbi:MAG: hypothetical protein AB8G14_17710 [Ilumatobacter sp.]